MKIMNLNNSLALLDDSPESLDDLGAYILSLKALISDGAIVNGFLISAIKENDLIINTQR